MSSRWFSEPTGAWFDSNFTEPTPAQEQGWAQIATGSHTLIFAPTGSGKTLAAFLFALDRLLITPRPAPLTSVVYLSPLRALAVDIEKNLRAPLRGIAAAAERLGHTVTVPTVGVRTGDTSADERRRLVRHPPDILITTPESLYLMLTSRARESLCGVECVIVDEIHAVAGTKRGSHLALSLERLEEIVEVSPQRIGLSATQRPLGEVARFLGGHHDDGSPRRVAIVDAGTPKVLDLKIVVPVEDMGVPDGPPGERPARSIWPAIHPRILDLIEGHRSTIVFVNARRQAERLATRLNELWTERQGVETDGVLVRAHHGSLSRELRLQIEDDLKAGRLRGLVATSSLELGIDMGAVDLVIQVESPGAVSRGLQRVGRAGHHVGAPSRGRIFPKHRADLLEAAVVVERMGTGAIEATRYPRNPLDVLAQQIVAMGALDDWPFADLGRVIRRSAPFAELSPELLRAVVDMLSGRYPSEAFAELAPRLVWDRVSDVVRGRAGAQRLAVTNPGTIPDRGLFGVFLGDGTRVGELDEEMVYESRPGETFLLGASTWRIDEITFDRVLVTPAPGQPGKMPFWHGDGPGRPAELGRAVGAMTRWIRSTPDAAELLERDSGLDAWAAANLVGFITEQADATGAVPDDRTIVVERFRDEIGDWRVCVHSPLGVPVHAPWGLALRRRLAERFGTEVEMIWSDDGIVLRLPESVDHLAIEDIVFGPDEITEAVIAELPSSAMFAARFRECAARALLLPRRRPDRRTPLWQQRQRSADLLVAASAHPTFPILLETTRECLHDVFDISALVGLMADIRSRRVRVVAVDTPHASPMAQSLLFSWIAVYMYEGDAPLAERRAAALALDRDLLRELLGGEELRELLDPGALADLEAHLQCRVDGRRAREPDELHDLLRRLGPLSTGEIADRSVAGAPTGLWIDELVEARRAFRASVGGDERIAAADDAGRLRDTLGVSLPAGLPTAFTDPVDDPLDGLVLRHARTHGPFTTGELRARWGFDLAALDGVLKRAVERGALLRGEFRPGGTGREWCDPAVLQQLRRRSLAALRREVEPVDATVLARFLAAWQGIGARRGGPDDLAEVVGQLQGAAIAASVLEGDVLSARLGAYRPGDLDALCSSGDVVWIGAGSLGASDGRIVLAYRDDAPLLVDRGVGGPPPDGPLHGAMREHLAARGSAFWAELVAAVQQAGQPYDTPSVLAALWDLVWGGEVTNDSLAPLRAFVGGGGAPARTPARRRGRHTRLAAIGPPAGSGRWSLVAPLLEPRPVSTEIALARARQLLDRYGVVTRESALAEGVPGGFAGLYPVLQQLEAGGQVRRGYFVAGLGAAQFALPGSVDRLRDHRDRAERAAADDDVWVLSAVDPAQPYGAVLAWPAPAGAGRVARVPGAHVVLCAGEPLAFVERGARSLVTFSVPGTEPLVASALVGLAGRRHRRTIELVRIDGAPAGESPLAPTLRSAGFRDTHRGLVIRR